MGKTKQLVIVGIVILALVLLFWKFGRIPFMLYYDVATIPCTYAGCENQQCPSGYRLAGCGAVGTPEGTCRCEKIVACSADTDCQQYTSKMYCKEGKPKPYCSGPCSFPSGATGNCCSYDCVECVSGADCQSGYQCVGNNCVAVAPPPVPPKPKPIWTNIIDKIKSWISSIFNWFTYSIVGTTSPLVGTTQTYSISISANVPDSDYSDGSYQLQQANWAFIDKSGNIIKQGNWEEVNGTYKKDVALVVPSNPSNFVLIATIYQYDMSYQNGQWVTTNEQVVGKEAIDITTKAPVPIKPTPSFSSIITNILTWLKGLFSWIFK